MNDEQQARVRLAVEALHGLGQAWRNDPDGLDGRTLRTLIEDWDSEVMSVALDPNRNLAAAIEEWRSVEGLCRRSGSHWDGDCGLYDCKPATQEAA